MLFSCFQGACIDHDHHYNMCLSVFLSVCLSSTYMPILPCFLGARIDHGHHYNVARKALEETVAMEDALDAALREVSLDDTLVIVTADHSHPITIGSYATRGNPILGACVILGVLMRHRRELAYTV